MNSYQRERNFFQCGHCGFMVSTESSSRNCAKCDIPMILLGTGRDKDKFIYKPKDDRV